MKIKTMKLHHIILVLSMVCLFSLPACTKYDNKDQPSMTLKGLLTDSVTGEGFQTEIGDNGTRFRMLDKSYSASPTAWYFTTNQDGDYNYTLIPAGTYNVTPLGAFIPMVILSSNGDTTKNASVTLNINGTITQNFTVVPFLVLTWVGEPVVNADNTITVQFKVERGTTEAAYQKDVQNIYLYVNSSSFNVGNNNYDSRYTVAIDNPNTSLGQVLTVTTPVLPFKNATYYLRAGARIDYSVDGVNRYNYNKAISVKVP